MCMNPICSPWLSHSITVFVFSLALLFPVKVNKLGGISMEMGQKIKYPQRALSDGPSANLSYIG